MSKEAGSRCMVLFADTDIPVVLPVPRTVDEFQQSGVRPGSKRNQRNEVNAEHTLRSGSPKFKERRSSKGKTRPKSLSSQPSTSQVFDPLSGNLKYTTLSNVTVYFLRGKDRWTRLHPCRLGCGTSTARHSVVSACMGVLARSSFRLHPHFPHSTCTSGLHSLYSSCDRLAQRRSPVEESLSSTDDPVYRHR
jgi:hypothetical protein